MATVALLYADRAVVVTDLLPERDPNLLDLCDEHLGRMTPPVGWVGELSGGEIADPRQTQEMSDGCYGHRTSPVTHWTHDA
jgi:hypothetical protein